MIRGDLARLQDARACAMLAIESSADTTLEAFVADQNRYRATLFNIAIIGEALGCVAAEVRSLAPDIEWVAIKAMRNHIVHSYWQIRPRVILRLAQSDLPALVLMLDDLLKRPETSFSNMTIPKP